jgi:NAD+-dependent protein deacetylase sirtuin 4
VHAAPGGRDAATLAALTDLVRGRRVVVLSGAGCSTESGIPDYRGPDGALRARQPIQYQEFVRSEEARARYWARSAIGWPRVANARANAAHGAIARLETMGAAAGVITQNVDGLHQEAGSRSVVELHGSLAWVRCLDCDGRIPRSEQQERLIRWNPAWAEHVERRSPESRIALAPDGDAELVAEALAGFRVPGCPRCDGMLKPDVVFFGENVPTPRLDEAWALFGRAEVLLVAGSSLTVFSGRRFIYRAEKEGIPIAVVNLGHTRADEVAAVKVEGQLGEVLPGVVAGLER